MKVIIIHPFIPAMVNDIENWLLEKSNEGLRLVRMKGWMFVFERSQILSTEYFIYIGFDASKGFSNEYYRAKQKYGKRKSKINKYDWSVFEVDPKKIDSDFVTFRILRNKYYKNHYLKLFIFSLFLEILSIIVSFYSRIFFCISLLFVIVNIYSLISFFVIKKRTGKKE